MINKKTDYLIKSKEEEFKLNLNEFIKKIDLDKNQSQKLLDKVNKVVDLSYDLNVFLLENQKLKVSINKTFGNGYDKWLVTLESRFSGLYRKFNVGYITYTVGRSGFSTHFKYDKTFNNLLRLTYYDSILGYKIYGVSNPMRHREEFKKYIYELDKMINDTVEKRIKTHLIPFIKKSLNTNIEISKKYSQFRRKLNSLLISEKIGKGITYRNFKKNLENLFPFKPNLFEFITNTDDDVLINMMSSQRVVDELPNLSDLPNDVFKGVCDVLKNQHNREIQRGVDNNFSVNYLL